MTEKRTADEILADIALCATKTAQDQADEVNLLAQRLGHAFADSPAQDHSDSLSRFKLARAKHEGMLEIVRQINGYRSGVYIGVNDTKEN